MKNFIEKLGAGALALDRYRNSGGHSGLRTKSAQHRHADDRRHGLE